MRETLVSSIHELVLQRLGVLSVKLAVHDTKRRLAARFGTCSGGLQRGEGELEDAAPRFVCPIGLSPRLLNRGAQGWLTETGFARE